MPRGVAKDPSKDKRRKNKGKPCPQRNNRKGKLQTIDQIKGDGRTPFSMERRRQIVWDYMIEGNASKVARMHNIDGTTIGKWKKRDWWEDLMQEAHDLYEQQLRARMNKVIDKALEKTEERLENGDVIFDAKRGELVAVPVKAKDAATIAGIQYDKRRLSLNLPTSIGGQSGSKQIEALADKFASLAKNFEYKQIRDENAIEGEIVEKKGS
jgi:hypothetical protein